MEIKLNNINISPNKLINLAVTSIKANLSNPQDPDDSVALKVKSTYTDRIEGRNLSLIREKAFKYARVTVSLLKQTMTIQYFFTQVSGQEKSVLLTQKHLDYNEFLDHLFVIPITQ